MSLARDMAFDPASEVLLRYGSLRQMAETHKASFRAAQPLPLLCLADPCKPGVLPKVREDVLCMHDKLPDVVAAQRQSAWINQLAWELASGTFLRALEALTGTEHLLPDPHFLCGGLLRGVPGKVPTEHPRWRLSTALVLDLLLSDAGKGAGVLLPGGMMQPVQQDGCVLWQAGKALPQPSYQVDARCVIWRSVYFYGAGREP